MPISFVLEGDINGDVDCSVEDVLVFSGADRVPPLGFEKQPTLTFIHNSSAKSATVSTCALELQLPTCHGIYKVAL